MPSQQLDQPGYVVVDNFRLCIGAVVGNELFDLDANDLITAMLTPPDMAPMHVQVDVVPWPPRRAAPEGNDHRSLDRFVRAPAVMMWAPNRLFAGHRGVDGLVELSIDHVKRLVLPEDGLGAERRHWVTYDLVDAGLLH